ncbi:MAG: RHS repeat-associated core domain-containing protein, partial [Myxococcales bacterium]|nr:RHS repeat-associated core domain-containing protein [Myxococcales bacterium]
MYRHYRPALGRWLRKDPAGDVDGPNLYRYAVNSPVNYVDPIGLWTVDRDSFGAMRPDLKRRLDIIDRMDEAISGRIRTFLKAVGPVGGPKGK